MITQLVLESFEILFTPPKLNINNEIKSEPYEINLTNDFFSKFIAVRNIIIEFQFIYLFNSQYMIIFHQKEKLD